MANPHLDMAPYMPGDPPPWRQLPSGLFVPVPPPPPEPPPVPPTVHCDLCGVPHPDAAGPAPFGFDEHRWNRHSWTCGHPATYTCRACCDRRHAERQVIVESNTTRRRPIREGLEHLYPPCPACGCHEEYT